METGILLESGTNELEILGGAEAVSPAAMRQSTCSWLPQVD